MVISSQLVHCRGLCSVLGRVLFAKASYTIALHASEHGKFWNGALQLLQDMKALASQSQQNNAAGVIGDGFPPGNCFPSASNTSNEFLSSQVAAVQPELADFRMVARQCPQLTNESR